MNTTVYSSPSPLVPCGGHITSSPWSLVGGTSLLLPLVPCGGHITSPSPGLLWGAHHFSFRIRYSMIRTIVQMILLTKSILIVYMVSPVI